MQVLNYDKPTPAKQSITTAPINSHINITAAVISAMPAYPNQQSFTDIVQNGLRTDAVEYLLKQMPTTEMWPIIDISYQSIHPAAKLLTSHMHIHPTPNPDIMCCTYSNIIIHVDMKRNMLILNNDCALIPYYLGSDESSGIFVFFYIDKSELHVYVPVHGNYINMDFKTAIGYEHARLISLTSANINDLEQNYSNDNLHCATMKAIKLKFLQTKSKADAQNLGDIFNLRYINRYMPEILQIVLSKMNFNPCAVDMDQFCASIASWPAYSIFVTDFFGIHPINDLNAQAMLEEINTVFS